MGHELVGLEAGWSEEAESLGRKLVQASREDMKVVWTGGNGEVGRSGFGFGCFALFFVFGKARGILVA